MEINAVNLLSFNFSVKFEKVCDGLSDCAKSSDENYCSGIILDDLYDYKHSNNGMTELIFMLLHYASIF